MDPNATLAEILHAAMCVIASDGLDHVRALDLAERVQSLDEWLTRGGFLPDAWAKSDPGYRGDAPHSWWNQHSNQLGDWCPWSGHVADDDDDACPATCPASTRVF